MSTPPVSPLLGTVAIAEPAADFVARAGEVFATFGQLTQDSGNVCYTVRCGGERYFVKTAGPAREREDPDVSVPHARRVELLRNAAVLANARLHPALPELLHVVESPDGPLLVYRYRDGELLHARRAERDDPTCAHQRFRALPVEQILAALDTVFDAHVALAAAGWIAVDFYDGSLLYDFGHRELHLIDLDMYARGPFVNRAGRMFGSTRFMAPEEHTRGATIDQRTNVFTLGRTAAVFLGNRGGAALQDVIARACRVERAERQADVASFHADWRAARTG